MHERLQIFVFSSGVLLQRILKYLNFYTPPAAEKIADSPLHIINRHSMAERSFSIGQSDLMQLFFYRIDLNMIFLKP